VCPNEGLCLAAGNTGSASNYPGPQIDLGQLDEGEKEVGYELEETAAPLRVWHHHVTLVAMAQAFLGTRRAERKAKEGPPPSTEEVAQEIHSRVVRRILQQAEAAKDPREREERMNRLWALHDAPLEVRQGRVVVRD
jgi:hypothetical protein